MTDTDQLWRGSSAERQAALPGPLRDLHRAVLRRFLGTGAAPTRRWIRQAATEHGLGYSAVADLAAADLVHVANGVTAVAYPFSGTPTRQQVELDGLPAVYSMCAIDALGIPAMAGRDGRITATDPRDDAPVIVSVRSGTWTWTPAEAVVIFGRVSDCGTDCASWETACPHTTFHTSRDSARAYLDSRSDIDGEILDQQAAIERGRRIFGPLLGRTA
ncbi:MAG: organomercurial lyase [Streptosporangiaceae bacterium]